MNVLVEEPYINKYGQKIEVGEEVLYMASSWSYTSHNKGYYAGVYKSPENKTIAVRVNHCKPYEPYGSSCLLKKRIFKLAEV